MLHSKRLFLLPHPKSTKMSTSNSFPPLDLRTLRIRDELELISDQSLFGFSIRNALNNKKPLREIVKMILDQYKATPEKVLDIVPQETITLIKEVYGKL